jgi:hypothetical protein
VGIHPEHAADLRAAGQAPERPEGDRVVAAEDERQPTLGLRAGNSVGDAVARAEDLGEVARALVSDGSGLGDRRLHVAEIGAIAAELLDPRLQPGVPDRRGTHVHAASARTEIEGRPDHRDGFRRHRIFHVGQTTAE